MDWFVRGCVLTSIINSELKCIKTDEFALPHRPGTRDIMKRIEKIKVKLSENG